MEAVLMTIQQAAARLACSPWAVRDLIWKGELAYVPLGKRHMVKTEDIDRLIERLTVRHGSGQITGKGTNGKKRA